MDIWKHGVYVDMWSVVHFLSGFILSGIFYKTGYELITAFIFSSLLLIAWEVFEWMIKIIEPSPNVVVDIIIGLFGFSVGAYLLYFTTGSYLIYFYTALVMVIVLSVWGFVDFLKRGYR